MAQRLKAPDGGGGGRHKFIALILLRIACVFLPGYVHPDEWFQSNEVAAQEVFNYHTEKPWEFTTDAPVRSVLSVYFSSQMAYTIAVAFKSYIPSFMAADVVTYAPRVMLCAMSFVVDLAVDSCARAVDADVTMARTMFASSWVTLVMLVRPFSNAVETCAVALAAFLATYKIKDDRRDYGVRCALIGVIGAIAIFIRITSAVYIAPWALLAVGRELRHSVWAGVLGIAGGVVAAVGAAMACIVIDTAYYANQSVIDVLSIVRQPDAWVITPLNLLRYNSNVDNLAIHGLHVRVLHVFVNGPMMFGPMWLACCCALVRPSKWRDESRGVIAALWGSVLLPLAVLSLVPHQEPRFLAPMIIPLCVLSVRARSGTVSSRVRNPKVGRGVGAFWVAFNILMAVVFGILHQGGVVRSARSLASSNFPFAQTSSVNAVFWKTYMPPQSVLAQPLDAVRVKITDIGGADAVTALTRLAALAAPPSAEDVADDPSCAAKIKDTVTVIVAPPSAMGELRHVAYAAGLDFAPAAARFGPHVSFDHLPQTFSALAAARTVADVIDAFVLATYVVTHRT